MKAKFAYVTLAVVTIVAVGSITYHRSSEAIATSPDINDTVPTTPKLAQVGTSAIPTPPNEVAAPGTEPPTLTAPTVSELTASLRPLATETLKEKLEELTKRIEDEEWIDRANRGDLTAETMTQFEELLNTETATRIVLLERDVAKAKDKYL